MAGNTQINIPFQTNIKICYFSIIVRHIDGTQRITIGGDPGTDSRPVLTSLRAGGGVTAGGSKTPGIIEAVIYKQGDFIFFTIVTVPVRLPHKRLRRHIASHTRVNGSLCRQKLRGHPARVFLSIKQQADGGVIRGQPRNGRREQKTIIVHIIHLGAAVALERHQPVQQLAVLGQRPCHIRSQLLTIKGTYLCPKLTLLHWLWQFRYRVDDATQL